MFSTLNLIPADPIYGMQVIYKGDTRRSKINLSIGVCLDEQSQLLRFSALNEAEQRVYQKRPSKEYLPITGLHDFCEKAQALVVGNDGKEELFSAQTVGGTGALFVAAKLLLVADIKEIFIPEPSWPNHEKLFQAAGLNVTYFPYYDKENMCLDFEKMVSAISQMQEGCAIVLQASCHNPTGVDPDAGQWQHISRLIKKKKLLPLFDLAYLGLGGGLQEDVQAIRIFLQDDHEMLICTTFAKSMGLYNDRVGLLTVKTKKTRPDSVASHIRAIIRATYSSPPAHGVLVANEILSDEKLKTMWLDELERTRLRLQSQRQMLYEQLKNHGASSRYEHLLHTKGLFCLFDLSPQQVTHLREVRGLYLALDGRIAVAAITQENAPYIAESLSEL